MIVRVPTALRSYTAGAAAVEADGASLAEVLVDLDRRYPGLRFRIVDEQDGIRTHIRLFVNGEPVTSLDEPIASRDEVHIMCALSGG